MAVSAEQAKQNLIASAALIGPRWVAGINGAVWQSRAASDQAETDWYNGVTQSHMNKTRIAGINRVSDSQWRQISVAKGQGIIGSRFVAAADKWHAAFSPMYSQILTLVAGLPPRTSDINTNIENRLKPVALKWAELGRLRRQGNR